MIKPQTLKGFRDFLPNEARKRQYVINTLKSVFELYGFEPLETPALEYEEILTGKYGEEGDKLMYRFEDNGKRRVALRYDQTVPLSRVVAQYQNELPFPFKRYQIQPVWRAENTQKGRFREFLQCDADIVGTDSPLADAEVIALAITSLQKLGFTGFTAFVNDRTIFEGVSKDAIVAIDKLSKIGEKGVLDELLNKKNVVRNLEEANELFKKIKNQPITIYLQEIFSNLERFGITKEFYSYSSIIARGLDYYTSTIFEIEIDGYTAGSVCGGGRYDNLIGMFAGRQIPAVGFAFGFDRLLEAMEQLKLFPADLQTAKVLVTIFNADLKEQSLQVSSRLRSNNINTELYLDENAKMEKQLKYANQKGIPYVIVIGPEEAARNTVQLKNMETREQKELPLEEVITLLK